MNEVRVQEVRTTDQEKLRLAAINEQRETERLERAADQIGQMKELRPEVWSGMSETQREWTLRHAGEKLSRIYECPVPPMIARSLGGSAGSHSDPEYLTRMDHNEFRSNNAYEALDTYCHEFRHAYQHEMAGRYDSGYMHRQECHPRSAREEMEARFSSPFRHLCHDEAKAAQWAENFAPGNYISANEDPERYRAQPVEKDAWDFAARITEAVRRRQQGQTGM